MTFTYDPQTDVGRVRRTIPDRDEAGAVLTDEEIASFIADEGDCRRATALALETIAANHALVFKVMRSDQESFDGAAVARVLFARAASLRDQATDDDAATEGGAWDVAEMVTGPFSYRERVSNEALRESV